MGRAKAEELVQIYDEKIVVLKARLEDRQRLLAEAMDKQEKRQKTVEETKQELADCRRKLENAQAYMARQAEKAAQAAERQAAPKASRKQGTTRRSKKSTQDADFTRLMESLASSGYTLQDVISMLQKTAAE